MHPAEIICFISVGKETQKKARRKRKEKDEKKMTRVRRNFPPGESYCDSLESKFHVSEVSLSGCQ
jgi:hypothetical protein